MKTIDWNTMSELGLLARINSEILHPLGLAMSRNPVTGASEEIYLADDKVWVYGEDIDVRNLTKEQIWEKLDD